MTLRTRPPLALLQAVLRGLIALNLAVGGCIATLLVASLLAEDLVMGALGVPALPANDRVIGAMRVVMVIGVVAVPIGDAVLRRIRRIVTSVERGTPFVAENAAHLTAIAWLVAAIEGLHLVVGVTSALASSSEVPLRLGWSPSMARWLAIILCVALAQVFALGTAMREDLEGTI